MYFLPIKHCNLPNSEINGSDWHQFSLTVPRIYCHLLLFTVFEVSTQDRTRNICFSPSLAVTVVPSVFLSSLMISWENHLIPIFGFHHQDTRIGTGFVDPSELPYLCTFSSLLNQIYLVFLPGKTFLLPRQQIRVFVLRLRKFCRMDLGYEFSSGFKCSVFYWHVQNFSSNFSTKEIIDGNSLKNSVFLNVFKPGAALLLGYLASSLTCSFIICRKSYPLYFGFSPQFSQFTLWPHPVWFSFSQFLPYRPAH